MLCKTCLPFNLWHPNLICHMHFLPFDPSLHYSLSVSKSFSWKLNKCRGAQHCFWPQIHKIKSVTCLVGFSLIGLHTSQEHHFPLSLLSHVRNGMRVLCFKSWVTSPQVLALSNLVISMSSSSKYCCRSFLLNNYYSVNVTWHWYLSSRWYRKQHVSGSMSRWLLFIFLAPNTVPAWHISIGDDKMWMNLALPKYYGSFSSGIVFRANLPALREWFLDFFFLWRAPEHLGLPVFSFLFPLLHLGPLSWPPFSLSAVETPLEVTWHSHADADLDSTQGTLGQAEG